MFPQVLGLKQRFWAALSVAKIDTYSVQWRRGYIGLFGLSCLGLVGLLNAIHAKSGFLRPVGAAFPTHAKMGNHEKESVDLAAAYMLEYC